MATTWHVLTGEYPPDCGGVGDYTAALAAALADTGDEVHVWTPSAGPAAGEAQARRVSLHVLPDVFGRGSRATLARAFASAPGPVLLQYVPNALGARGGNLAFCRWFSRLAPRVADVRVMFHEPYFYFRWSRPWSASNGLALIQRMMARTLLRGASRVYFSTESWTRYLSAPQPPQTLPVPSSIPIAAGAAEIARVRAAATGADHAAQLVGHFGTYGAHVTGQLDARLPALVARMPSIRLALLGAGGSAYLSRLAGAAPAVAARAWAPDRLEPAALACALRACDLLVQPYPDGITTRRTSAMAGLKNGVATVSTTGALTEAVWEETGAVALAPAGDVGAFVGRSEALLRDPGARTSLASRAASVYASRFSMEHTLDVLRGPHRS